MDEPAPQPGEDFCKAVLDGLPEAVFVTTPEGTITYANAALQALLGYVPSQLVGQPLTSMMPRRLDRRVDPVKWLARWAADPNVEAPRYLDLITRHSDGHDLPVDVRVRSGLAGGREQFFVTLRDKTLERADHLALKDENLRAARILMVAEDAIVSVDADQKIILFNLAAERMFGYRAEEALGQPLSMLLPPEVRDGHGKFMEQFRASKEPSKMMGDRPSLKGVRRDGQVFDLEATITKVQATGHLTFTAHLRDVTERNRARQELEERERRIRAVFDNASEAITLVSPDGDILEMNRAAAALAADRSLAGVKLWDAPWLGAAVGAPLEAVAPIKAAFAKAAAGETVETRFDLPRKGGSQPVAARMVPVKDAKGAVIYVLSEGRLGG